MKKKQIYDFTEYPEERIDSLLSTTSMIQAGSMTHSPDHYRIIRKFNDI
tara:strand:+ start:141 stop:287 length:147 start_codon:yes stop_codon:yes gene_type:complete